MIKILKEIQMLTYNHSANMKNRQIVLSNAKFPLTTKKHQMTSIDIILPNEIKHTTLEEIQKYKFE